MCYDNSRMAQFWLQLAVVGVLTGVIGSPSRASNVSRQATSPPSTLPAATQASPAIHTILVFPFENQSRKANLEWLSDGLAELTVDRLDGGSRFVFSREDRLDALERMGLPSTAQFSVATMIAIAREIGAGDVVFGSYTSDGKTLSVTARVLLLNSPQLSDAMSATGPLANLLPLNAHLAGSIMCALDAGACPGGAPPASVSDPRRPPSNLEAFQTYIRAITGPADEQRLRDLRDAARLEPDWDLPAFELGLEEFERRDCESALVWLSRVPPDRPRGVEATFDAGVCHLLGNDASRAASSFQDVLDRDIYLASRATLAADPRPQSGVQSAPSGASRANDSHDSAADLDLPEARNDLGVAYLKLGTFADAVTAFQRAAQLAPDTSDYLFNLGIAQFLAGDAAGAQASLRHAQSLAPDDAGIHGAIEQMMAQSSPAAAPAPGTSAHKSQASISSAVSLTATWTARARISPRLDREWLRPGGPASASAVAGQQPTGGAQESVALHLDRGQQFLKSGDLDDAQRAFTEALLSAPYDAAAHRGLAEVYRRQGRPDDALRELSAAISNLNDAPTHVEMAQLLIEMNRPTDARDQLHQALAIDPANSQAHQLLDKLDGSAEPGGTP
jgi:Flp pilus assembly protein TadD/TolB-like protein